MVLVRIIMNSFPSEVQSIYLIPVLQVPEHVTISESDVGLLDCKWIFGLQVDLSSGCG
jgi:hypothetical protein